MKLIDLLSQKGRSPTDGLKDALSQLVRGSPVVMAVAGEIVDMLSRHIEELDDILSKLNENRAITESINVDLKAKIENILSSDSPRNYECWEDAEESMLEELTGSEAEEYLDSGTSLVEEWFAANEEDEG